MLQHALLPPGGKGSPSDAVYKHNVQQGGVCRERRGSSGVWVEAGRKRSDGCRWRRVLASAGKQAGQHCRHGAWRAQPRPLRYPASRPTLPPAPAAVAPMPSRASTSWCGANGSNRCTPSCTGYVLKDKLMLICKLRDEIQTAAGLLTERIAFQLKCAGEQRVKQVRTVLSCKRKASEQQQRATVRKPARLRLEASAHLPAPPPTHPPTCITSRCSGGSGGRTASSFLSSRRRAWLTA